MNLSQNIVKHMDQSLSKFQLNIGRQTFNRSDKKRVRKQPQLYADERDIELTCLAL